MDQERRGGSGWLRTAICLVVVAVLAVGAYFVGAVSSGGAPSAASDGPPVSAPQREDDPQVAAPAVDPVASAIAWLRASRELSYQDGSPTAWIDRAMPVVTGELQTQYQQARAGSVGADWDDFLRDRCRTSVEGPAGVIPAEAPRTASVVAVQVTGNVQTSCEAKDAAVPPVETVAATLELSRAKDGFWRVSQRLY